MATPLFGIDIHPEFQATLNIEQAARDGNAFLSVKLTNGTTSFENVGAGAASMIRRGKAAGMLTMGYHWLYPGNETAQAQVFAAALARNDVPGVLDAEDVDSNGHATLTIAGIRAFVAECRRLSAPLRLMYLPNWYWDRIGRPDLTGLPTLWASSYVAGGGVAAQLYEAVTPNRWASYGGLPVGLLQFTEAGQTAGYHPVDCNAYLGTTAELAALLGTTVNPGHRKDRSTMDQLPATASPTNPNSDPATWPQRNFDIPFDLAGGWEGECAIAFGGQDWGGRTTDRIRSFLFLASWMLHDGTLVPVDATHTAKGGGQAVAAHTVAGPWQAPHGAVGVTLNYASPAGGYVARGRSA